MKVYKVTYYSEQESSEGFYFTSSLKDAKANNKVQGRMISEHCDKEIDVLEITPTKKGIIKALNRHASHNDNG